MTREVRERTIASLKRTRLFRDVSVRLLADLVDRYGVIEVSREGGAIPAPALLVVHDGRVELSARAGDQGEGGAEPPVFSPLEGDAAAAAMPTATGAPATMAVPLDTGLYVRNRDPFPRGFEDAQWSIRALDTGRVHAYALPLNDFRRNLPRALRAALDPALAADVAKLAPLQQTAEALLVWMAHDRKKRTPLYVLTHLLASAVAQDLRVPVVIVALGGRHGLRIETWDGRDVVPWHGKIPQAPLDAEDLRGLTRDAEGNPRHGWVFVAHLDDPLHRPPPDQPGHGLDADVAFDRVVLVTDEVPTAIPEALRVLLDGAHTMDPRGIRRNDLGFCAVTPSVVVAPRTATVGLERLLGPGDGAFRTDLGPSNDRLRLPGSEGEEARLLRDACRLRIDVSALEQAWAKHNPARPFIEQVDEALRASVHRWGRAVTNRRVGVAVSGGGACAYRLAGLIARLEDTGVPIDVVAGLSGGALVGAYYCARGRDGLEQIVRRGPLFGMLLPLALASSWFIEAAIDLDLGGARIEETPVRYVPVTAELSCGAEPCARVVATGTVGEAVRVSGSLPLLFGPTVKNGVRYTDGGAAALVPAEIARCSGADLTVSYNVMAEPADGTPLMKLPLGLGDLVRQLPLVERLVDLWVWTNFLWARASRNFGACADVAIHFRGDPGAALEPGAWGRARDIALAGYRDPEVVKGAREVRRRWETLQRTP